MKRVERGLVVSPQLEQILKENLSYFCQIYSSSKQVGTYKVPGFKPAGANNVLLPFKAMLAVCC